jgi:hypothetical protein
MEVIFSGIRHYNCIVMNLFFLSMYAIFSVVAFPRATMVSTTFTFRSSQSSMEDIARNYKKFKEV